VWSLAAIGAALAAAAAALLSGAGSHPGLALAVTVVVAVHLTGVRVRRHGDLDRWRRGADGELATAEMLAALPGRRWVVLHDRAVPAPGSRANIDHVAVGPTGVWVIDSKAYRAPLRAGWRSVRAGDRPVDTSPAAWEASAVAGALDRAGFPGVDVRPVVVVHGPTGGRPLARRGRRIGGVQVLPADGLVERLSRRRGSARLRRRDVRALAAACEAVLAPAAGGPLPVTGRAG
jgi:hypothetical protein